MGLERLPVSYLSRQAIYDIEELGTTHSKVLVVDRSFVVHTSFNWLSFKGDPKGAFRDERGFLVSEPTMVDSVFTEWEARFQ